jgi:hypothetical protein
VSEHDNRCERGGNPCEAWWAGLRSWTLVVLKSAAVIVATLCAWDLAKAALQ